jgi:glycerophosphoryl diester phosphodiesterase
VSRVPALRRVGHKGAGALAAPNTPAAFDAALAAGVDMIEFDVLPADADDPLGSPLLLLHDYDRGIAGATPLEEALAHLAGPAFAGVELDVDLKWHGYEARVADALAAAGLVERSLVSSAWMRSLVAVGRAEPGLRTGWSVPRVRRDYTASRLYALPAHAALAWVRRRLPRAAAGHLRAGRCQAVMAHWRLVSPALVRAVRDSGGELYAWTVDDAGQIRALEALGVTGVITNDPRLFAAPVSAAGTSPR